MIMMKNGNNNTVKANRQRLAIALACRRYLYRNGFSSAGENLSINARIIRRMDEQDIEISEKQIQSVVFGYED